MVEGVGFGDGWSSGEGGGGLHLFHGTEEEEEGVQAVLCNEAIGMGDQEVEGDRIRRVISRRLEGCKGELMTKEAARVLDTFPLTVDEYVKSCHL